MKEQRQYNGEKVVFSTNQPTHAKNKLKLDTNFTHFTKINSKMDQRPKYKMQNYKVPRK